VDECVPTVRVMMMMMMMTMMPSTDPELTGDCSGWVNVN
jgi:hypothetical protein